MLRGSDEELLLAWRDGSSEAGAALFRNYFRLLHRFFASKISNESVVEDLVQQTFLACVERRSEAASRAGFRAYLLGIARRRLMRFFRGAYRERTAMAAYGPDVDQPAPSPSSALSLRSEVQAVAAAIRRIPIDQQITLELYYQESLPVQEIASILEIAPGTVKSRLARARTALAEAVEALEADPDLVRRTSARLDFWTSEALQSSDD